MASHFRASEADVLLSIAAIWALLNDPMAVADSMSKLVVDSPAIWAAVNPAVFAV